LAHGGQLGVEAVEQRAGHEVVHAPAALGQLDPTRPERPAVAALHEMQPRIAQHRSDQARGEVRTERLGGAVQKADDVAAQDGERAPHGVTLAEHRPQAGNQRRLVMHIGARIPGQRRGGVLGVGVHHHDLVDHA